MTRVTPSAGSEAAANGASHLCRQQGCGRWGAWGYDAGDGISDWWCLEHRPNQDPVRPVVEQNWVSDGNEG
jgi:hypothetical protein